jgi:hypothetical protein
MTPFLPNSATIAAMVYQHNRNTTWWLYPLPTQINAETSSSDIHRNFGLLPSGGFGVSE